jgi:hypothetical protein
VCLQARCTGWNSPANMPSSGKSNCSMHYGIEAVLPVIKRNIHKALKIP